MQKLTKKYANGKVTIDAAMFGVEQTTLDIEIFNNEAITAAVAKLHEYEKINCSPPRFGR